MVKSLVDRISSFELSIADARKEVALTEDPNDRIRGYTELMLREPSDAALYVAPIRRANEDCASEKLKLEAMAHGDTLTGLNNRRYYDNVVKEVSSNDEDDSASLIYFDIDHFKTFNDTYGHAAGDYVLSKLGKVIKKTMRHDDISCCRYGGEEFAVILPSTSGDGAYIAAEHLRKAVEDADWEYEGRDLGQVTISLGVSELKSKDNVDAFFARADKRLYKAKSDGRNRTVFKD